MRSGSIRTVRTRSALLLLALLVGATAATLFYFRYFRYPPLPARLLPDEAEAYLYVDFGTIRSAAAIAPGSILGDPEVAEFSRQTGIVPERDVDEFALAAFPEAAAAAGTSPERRFAQAITGHFDVVRLTAYLRSKGATVRYRDYEIYEIPREDRLVRVAVLDPHLVVITNMKGSDAIRWMLDRYEHVSFPRSGPYRMRVRMHKVPLGAIAWAMVRLRSAAESMALPMPGGMSLQIPGDADIIASGRALSALELRAETDVARERPAHKLAEELRTYLTLFRAVEITMGTGGPDPDVRKLFDSVRVQQDGSKVTVTAEVPYAFLKKMARENQMPAQSREDNKGKR